jgi:hypothetical protein
MSKTYSRKDFGNDLRVELGRGYEIKRLSDWAHKIYLHRSREFEPGLQQVVLQLIAMEEGEEFEFSEKELQDLVARLTDESKRE